MAELPRNQSPTPDGGENQWRSGERQDTVEIEYDADTGTYRASYDSTTDSVCMVVISTVAVIEDTEPRELEPIYPVVAPDALDSLFASKRDGIPRTGGEVQFTYCGYEITVSSDGEVRVVPTEEKP